MAEQDQCADSTEKGGGRLRHYSELETEVFHLSDAVRLCECKADVVDTGEIGLEDIAGPSGGSV